MIEKIVHTAKHAVKASVLIQSAPSAPLCLPVARQDHDDRPVFARRLQRP